MANSAEGCKQMNDMILFKRWERNLSKTGILDAHRRSDENTENATIIRIAHLIDVKD